MPSPFPGMNPYIERADVWQDFHDSFIPFMRDDIARHLPDVYYVKIEETVYIHELSAEERRFLGRPDISVHHPQGYGAPDERATSSQTTAPCNVFIPVAVDELRIPYLEIRDRRDRQVVTIIELLSPSNKALGNDRQIYWGKVIRIQKTHTTFIELDLLRGGPRMPWEEIPPCDYYAMVSRWPTRPQADFWPIQLRDRLPVIPIPLRAGEPEITLDLQAVLHRVYDSGMYERFIYEGDPEPPLTPEDAAWAKSLISIA